MSDYNIKTKNMLIGLGYSDKEAQKMSEDVYKVSSDLSLCYGGDLESDFIKALSSMRYPRFEELTIKKG